jgi:Arc/MetJ-type ribon-helix-helix transcriptional regulator
MALTRISITIPRPLVAEADLLAGKLDRSRSWVVAEAVRRYLEQAADDGGSERSVREVTREPRYRLGPGEYRLAQLEADLGLTPEDRVREAEGTASLSEAGHREWGWQRVLVFERYEDYLAWERWADLSSP